MKLKPKGRKIYRQKTRFERLRAFKTNTGAIATTILLVGILGFVGYSAGGPVLRFMQERKILAVPGQEPEVTEAPLIIDALPVETVPVMTEPEQPAEPETEPIPEIAPEAPEFHGYALPVSALAGEATLKAALEAVPAEATHILIPLKTSGGNLYYATTLEDAGKTGAVRAVMPLETIYEMAAAGGAEPVAVVNTLEDTVYPASFQLAAYRLAEGEECWADADGKLWLSPFSDLTLDYLANLTGEIAGAGFTSFVCEGLRFPEFPQADLEKLEPGCSAPDRYTGLVNVVEAMQNAAPDAAFYLKIEGMQALANQSDALTAAEQLDAEAVMVTVNAATQNNTDLLRTLTTVHPSILVWDAGIGIPADENSFVQHMETAVPES